MDRVTQLWKRRRSPLTALVMTAVDSVRRQGRSNSDSVRFSVSKTEIRNNPQFNAASF